MVRLIFHSRSFFYFQTTESYDFSQDVNVCTGLNLKSEVKGLPLSCENQSYIFNSTTFVLTPQIKIEPPSPCQPQSINSILNSKIKIKPKPVDGTPSSAVVPAVSGKLIEVEFVKPVYPRGSSVCYVIAETISDCQRFCWFSLSNKSVDLFCSSTIRPGA